jgi:methionine synthase II (cobalamin-independent)
VDIAEQDDRVGATVRRRSEPRAETVGSLLRPAPLKQLFERIYGHHDSHVRTLLSDEERALAARLDELASEEIVKALRRQEEIGLDVVTDGEMRRAHFVNSLFDSLYGLAENPEKYYFAGAEDIAPPSDPRVVARLEIAENPLVVEVSFLRRHATRPFKVTVPAPSNFYMLDYPRDVYASREDFIGHFVDLLGELVTDAVGAGLDYVQFDFPLYPALADPEKRVELEAALGEPGDALLDRAIAADNAVLAKIPDGITTGLHMCRGNFRSRWWAQGSLEPVAEQMFSELRYDRLLIEWEDVEREGDYRPLRFVPSPGPVVVMGLVSSKLPALESDDDIARRIDAAAQHLDLGQLALSPQCGFASVWHGNELSEEDQWSKLELVTRVADRAWGDA